MRPKTFFFLLLLLLLPACQIFGVTITPDPNGPTRPTELQPRKSSATATFPVINTPSAEAEQPASAAGEEQEPGKAVAPGKIYIPILASPPQVFDISSANKGAPADVLSEVSYTPSSISLACYQGLDTYSGPYIDIAPLNNELMEGAVIFSCGWSKEETLSVVIQYPDGSVTEALPVTVLDESDSSKPPTYFLVYMFLTGLNDPPGKYTYTVTGTAGQVETSNTFSAPDGPRAYWQDDGSLLLHNFAPSENVRLFALVNEFAGKLTVAGWQAYQVGSNGQLTIQVNPEYAYIVIGETSGEVHPGNHGLDGKLSDGIEEIRK